MGAALLEPIFNIIVPISTTKFIAGEKFVVCTDAEAQVRIASIMGSFYDGFLTGDVRGLSEQQTLCCSKLLQTSSSELILATLGGENEAEVTLEEMYCPMVEQGSRESNTVLSRELTNLFFIRDVSGILQAVKLLWMGNGWGICSHAIDNQSNFVPFCRVFSRLRVKAA